MRSSRGKFETMSVADDVRRLTRDPVPIMLHGRGGHGAPVRRAELPITALPRPLLGGWLGGRRPFAAALSSYASLNSSGRAAIYWAFRGLNPRPGSRVWLPAYHCGAEVQAVADAGWQVGFYRVCSDLTIDLNDLQDKLYAQPGPVVVIHYFGFGQPGIACVDEMCRSRGVPWMEDCAHALFSSHEGRALGTLAPLAIFSLRKTLPLVEGGALQLNCDRLADLEHFKAPPRGGFSLAPHRAYLREAVHQKAGSWAIDLYQRLRGIEIRETTEWVETLQQRDRYLHRMAGISCRAAAATDPFEVVRRRRANWMTLDQRLSGSPGYRRVFESLPPGVCPLFLVIRVSQRKPIIAAMREKGIEPFVFGALRNPRLDGSKFPDDAALRGKLLCLPVHQQLDAEHMDRIASCVRPLLVEYGQ